MSPLCAVPGRCGQKPDGPNDSDCPSILPTPGSATAPTTWPRWRSNADFLLGYFEDVHQTTVAFLGSLDPSDLDRVVDDRWDPPVSMSVRLMSVVADDLQHVGQAAYVRGLLLRR